MSDLPLCVAPSMDANVAVAMNALESKFTTFAKLLGDDCLVFNQASALFKDDVINQSKTFAKEMEQATKDIADVASTLMKELANTPGLIQDGIIAVQNALEQIHNIMDQAIGVVKEVMNNIKETANAMKIAACQTAAAAVKNLPASVAAGAISLAVVHDYKGFMTNGVGGVVAKRTQLDQIATQAIRLGGIVAQKDTLKVLAANAKTLVPSLQQFVCNPATIPPY